MKINNYLEIGALESRKSGAIMTLTMKRTFSLLNHARGEDYLR